MIITDVSALRALPEEQPDLAVGGGKQKCSITCCTSCGGTCGDSCGVTVGC